MVNICEARSGGGGKLLVVLLCLLLPWRNLLINEEEGKWEAGKLKRDFDGLRIRG